jgi:hypothetical protein
MRRRSARWAADVAMTVDVLSRGAGELQVH